MYIIYPAPTATKSLFGDNSIKFVLSLNSILVKIPNSTFSILVPINFALFNIVLLKFTPVKSAFVKFVYTNSPPANSAPGILIPLRSFYENE